MSTLCSTAFSSPHALAFDYSSVAAGSGGGGSSSGGGRVLVADSFAHAVRVVDGGTGEAKLLAGSGSGQAGFADGAAVDARFNKPLGLAVDAAGVCYVADSSNHRVRRISPQGDVRCCVWLFG